MFLTSVIATFLAGLSVNTGFTITSSSENAYGQAVVQSGFALSSIATHGQVSPKYSIYYSSVDDSGNSFKTEVFYLKYNPTLDSLTYGYNGLASNVCFSANITLIDSNPSYYRTKFVTEMYGTGDDFDLSISDYNVTQNTNVIVKVCFSLVDESDYSYVADGGYHDGYVDGFNAGVSEGSQEGRENGYYDGFKDAKELYENQDATVNSIFQGILSIGLIPVEFFMSIFNFSVLGVNITSIVSAILTLMVLVILMRIILGGKGKE